MLDKIENDLLYLIKCGAFKTAPDIEKVNQMDMEELYSLAKKHSIAAFIAYVLNTMNEVYPLQKKWNSTLNQAVRYRMVMDNYAKKLFAFLEERKCWYTPLKGYILKDYYPAVGTRQMGDVDVLFDPSFRKIIHDYFLKEGFTTNHFNKSNHDIYLKDIYGFEMHVSLFLNARNPVFDNFFEDIFPLLKQKGKSYEYEMPSDLFYVYMVAHAAKHYELGGTGIRQLIDFYYIYENYDLDFNHIQSMIDEIGISGCEKILRNLVQHLFKNEPLSEQEEYMLKYMFDSGTHGSLEHKVESRMDEAGQSRVMYWIHRAFPGRNWFAIRHPFIAKHPVLIPFFWVYRFYLALFPKRWKLKAENEAIKNMETRD